MRERHLRLSKSWLEELSRFAIPARAVKKWVPHEILEQYWPSSNVDAMFGHDPAYGWYCLHRKQGIVSLVFSERPTFFNLRPYLRVPKHKSVVRVWIRTFKQGSNPYVKTTSFKPGRRIAV